MTSTVHVLDQSPFCTQPLNSQKQTQIFTVRPGRNVKRYFILKWIAQKNKFFVPGNTFSGILLTVYCRRNLKSSMIWHSSTLGRRWGRRRRWWWWWWWWWWRYQYWSPHLMGMTGQLHAPGRLNPQERACGTERRAGSVVLVLFCLTAVAVGGGAVGWGTAFDSRWGHWNFSLN